MRGILTAILSAACLAACEKAERSTEQLQHQASETWQRLADLTAGSKDDAAHALEGELARLRVELDQLAEQAQAKGASGRDELLAELRQQRERAEAKLAELRASGAEQWKRVCAELQSETERLSQSCREALDGH